MSKQSPAGHPRARAVVAALAAAIALAACADPVAPLAATRPRFDAAPATPTDTTPADTTAAPRPEPTPAGLPTGISASATIGPAGGTLASPDGRLVITVPEGAVDTATTFAVQPIEGTATGGVGGGYRLSPHGAAFARPVRLSFRYDSALVRGTAPALLRVAAQDDSGRWWMYRTELDSAERTVSVNAPHFSDWSLVSGAQLLPHTATVNVGEALTLRVRVCDAEPPATDADSLLAPLAYACRDTSSAPLGDWAVNGVPGGDGASGIVLPLGTSAVYTAPAAVPASNPVAVTVGWDAATTLVSNVTVVDSTAKCAYLRDVASWDGTFGMSYALSATKPGKRDNVAMRFYADVTSRLTRFSQGPNGVTWQGPIDGGVMRAAMRTEDYGGGDTPYVSVTTGAGGAVETPMMSEPSRVTLSVNLRTCTYTVSFVGSVGATLTAGEDPPVDIEAGVGSVRVGPRLVGGRTALSGAGSFDAHTAMWGLMNQGDAFLFATFMIDPVFGGYVEEGGAGAARASWSFTPARQGP